MAKFKETISRLKAHDAHSAADECLECAPGSGKIYDNLIKIRRKMLDVKNFHPTDSMDLFSWWKNGTEGMSQPLDEEAVYELVSGTSTRVCTV